MAESSEEWELSKENIRPIQQGRKQNALKVALAHHPEDVITQQRQSFENELRTYSGNDPLAVWCKYIKWVEQNYPKGGREGHIKKLLEHCLSILKNDNKYFDDDRFIDIMLKYANLSGKPIEVYNYMYSSNIGCKSAKFFINWSWELEQLGNMKKADEVLTEGIQRIAEPIEKIQSYRADFEIRLIGKIKTNIENNDFENENSRSAFAVLKPHKKNLAPVVRTGEAVVEKKSSLLLGRQQPQPRSSNTSSGKVPFKIYGSENINPSLPVQSQSAVRSSFKTENYKENEQKPIKWNKFKVKSHSVKLPTEANPDFKFHCDDENDQQIQTPRSVPKTSNILSTRRRTPSPPIALFEPPDPFKKPMYPKNKVYGGAVEYSLEEIRAAEWQEKKKKAEQERLVLEQQKKIEEQAKNEEHLKKEIEYLSKKVHLLQSQFTGSTALSRLSNAPIINNDTNNLKNKVTDEFNDVLYNNQIKSVIEASTKMPTEHIQSNPQNISRTPLKENSVNVLSFKNNLQNCNYSSTETFENKCTDSTSYCIADKMIQELYNRTLSQATDEDESTNLGLNKVNEIDLAHSVLKENSDKLPFTFYHDSTSKIPDSNGISSREFVNENALCSLSTATKQLNNVQSITKDSGKFPFTFYHDPSGSIYNSNEANQIGELLNISKEPNDKLPFTFYHDSTKNISNSSEANQISKTHSILKESHDKLPFTFFNDPTETIPNSDKTTSVKELAVQEQQPSIELPHEQSSEEDIENIPPKGYVQESAKRELAGILEPSKNILFIPLEQQELDDESDTEDDYIYQNGQQHTDDTLIPPSNTEQFSTAKFLASTPYIPRINKTSNLEKSNHQIPSPEVNKVSENLSPTENNFVTDENAVSKIELNPIKEPGLTNELKSACYSRLPNILSVIMETSTENYSKSSSSSSSASLTKSNHLEQYSGQHFSLHKHISKVETCEISTINSVSEVSNHNSDINFSNASLIMHKKIKKTNKIQLYSVDFDPFDQKVIQKLLKSINIDNYKNLCRDDKPIRVVKVGENINIGNSTYVVESLIAEGAYAKVFKAVKSFVTCSGYSKRDLALKVCKKANGLEFYICCEVQRRLSELKVLPDVGNSVMNIISAIKYSDGIVLANEYSDLGTLLDVVNFYKKQNAAIPELIVMYFTLEILHIVSKVHKCNIIHCDIKADNFLLTNYDFDVDLGKMTETTCLRLIDFGRAIDLNLYDKGICFTSVFKTKDFQCTEMKNKKPWVFQLDWYGVLNCIHSMLFSKYMEVIMKNGVWGIKEKFKRYWFTSLWEPLFHTLLNIPECYEEPDVSSFISMIESKLQENESTFFNSLSRFSSAYSIRK